MEGSAQLMAKHQKTPEPCTVGDYLLGKVLDCCCYRWRAAAVNEAKEAPSPACTEALSAGLVLPLPALLLTRELAPCPNN